MSLFTCFNKFAVDISLVCQVYVTTGIWKLRLAGEKKTIGVPILKVKLFQLDADLESITSTVAIENCTIKEDYFTFESNFFRLKRHSFLVQFSYTNGCWNMLHLVDYLWMIFSHCDHGSVIGVVEDWKTNLKRWKHFLHFTVSIIAPHNDRYFLQSS